MPKSSSADSCSLWGLEIPTIHLANEAILNLNSSSNTSRRTIAVLLLLSLVAGAVALGYGPLTEVTRMTTTTVTTTQLVPMTTKLDPALIYAEANRSVVAVQGVATDLTGPVPTPESVLGTGFVVTYGNSDYIVTNFHVVDGLANSTVTFSDGNAYQGEVVGSDAYSDLAVVSVECSPSEFHPLQLGVSSSLEVGESVVAIGNPYGLSGTITVGVVSQVGRSLQEDTLGGFAIADTIQFSAAINPGNSGGPLIDSNGMVVGIVTAVAVGSEGIGFAIPSDTISRELPLLVRDGKYDRHPYLGVQLVDMNYQLSQAMRTNLTWGVLIENTVPGGPASKAGLRGGTQNVTIVDQQYLIGGDIIISLDGNRIVNYDALSAYLEEHAFPGQTIQVGIVRLGNQTVIPVEMGTRPPIG
jgi:S1-C subfamily serine protease